MLTLFMLLVVVALAAVVALYLHSVRKTIRTKKHEVDERWRVLHATMQNRSQVLPQLVAEVQKTTGFEQDVFNSVQVAARELGAASSVEETSAAIEAGRESAEKLYAIAEYYPQLTKSPAYLRLKAEATEVEARVERDSTSYNRVVAEYNGLLSASSAGRAYAKRARLLAYRFVSWRNAKGPGPSFNLPGASA